MFLHSSIPGFLSPQHPIQPHTLSSSFDAMQTQAIYNNQPITIPETTNRTQLSSQVLGVQDQSKNNQYEEKKIFVDLTNQKLYAFEQDELIYSFPISSGKWGRTPTGTFRIWIKLKSTLMSGGSQALGTYYYLPNVPYTMYFYNNAIPRERGYGIHGAYWHNNFGHPMSHGCINMKPEDAEKLYYWASPEDQGSHTTYPTPEDLGTEITIFGTAPMN